MQDNIEEKERAEDVAVEEKAVPEEENGQATEDAACEEVQDSEAEEEILEEAAEEADAETEDGTVPKERKSFFKKKEKKDKKDEKIEELNDRLIRSIAEFDNFRKRTEKEKAQMFEIGAKDIVEKILPVIDNFERGLATVPEAEKEGAFVQGIELVYKQLLKALEDAGVKPIEAVGKEFDPNFHNAVMHAEDESFGENIVAEEFQKGYMYRDSVVRHSMVKVVN
ncbi:MAG: nucleotide exchange factor GrpE [Lachnospiraceae bacterium]|nr:nucleotide exchange factor GrpE [Lachnospiraceae bacterium]